MIRIAIVINSLAGGGAEKVMLRLASALQELGHDVNFIVIDSGLRKRSFAVRLIRNIDFTNASDSLNPKHGILAEVQKEIVDVNLYDHVN